MRCKNCKDKFVVKYFLQKYCMDKDECIKAFIQDKKGNEIKEKISKMKENLISHKDYIKIFQTVFNTFIRLRDKDKPCISCGVYKCEEFHAGHYIASTYQYLRFNELNVHKQCSKCNTHLRGNLIPYRIELINRIGLNEVENLENNRHQVLQITIPEIKEQIKKYKVQIKSLQIKK
jgi:hypothetical protein